RPLRMVSAGDSEISAPVSVDTSPTRPLSRPASDTSEVDAQVATPQENTGVMETPEPTPSGGLKLALAVGVGVLVLAIVAIVGVGYSRGDSTPPPTAPAVTETTPDVPVVDVKTP